MGGNFSCSSKKGSSWLLQRIAVAFSSVVWFKDINPAVPCQAETCSCPSCVSVQFVSVLSAEVKASNKVALKIGVFQKKNTLCTSLHLSLSF